MEEQKIYEYALKLWGAKFQSDMMIEEMSELTKAILKYRRGNKNKNAILEEIIDVEIMLNQMKILLNEEKKYKAWKEIKLENLTTLILTDDRFKEVIK